MNNETYKKVSFRLDTRTFNELQLQAKSDYLSISAYIRKLLDKELNKGESNNELQRTDNWTKTTKITLLTLVLYLTKTQAAIVDINKIIKTEQTEIYSELQNDCK